MLLKVKYILVGILVGSLLGATLAYAAAARVFLIDGNEQAVGTTANPLYISF